MRADGGRDEICLQGLWESYTLQRGSLSAENNSVVKLVLNRLDAGKNEQHKSIFDR
jgi:hypothetical protein